MNVLPKFAGMTAEEVRKNIKRFPFSIAMYNPSYGINMGAVLRNCNAFGASEFIRVGKRKFDRRNSLGVQNYETIRHFEDWKAALKWMRAQNYFIVGVDYIEGKSHPIHKEAFYPGHVVYILGNERNGLPQEVIDAADYIVHIEQFGSIPSLNVAVASGIIMNDWHEKRRQYEQTNYHS